MEEKAKDKESERYCERNFQSIVIVVLIEFSSKPSFCLHFCTENVQGEPGLHKRFVVSFMKQSITLTPPASPRARIKHEKNVAALEVEAQPTTKSKVSSTTVRVLIATRKFRLGIDSQRTLKADLLDLP